jgi:thiol-disulfide isomerase/thioredoxin
MKTKINFLSAMKRSCILIKTDPAKKLLSSFPKLKIKFLIILLLLISSISSGQAPKGTISLEDSEFNRYFINTAKIPIVKGKILNLPNNDFQKITISYIIVTPLSEFHNKKITNVNSDGTFNLQLDYPFPYQQIWLQIGDTLYTCLYANSDLNIELDATKIDKKNGIWFNGNGIKFLGSDGELTTLMNNHILFKRKLQLEINEEIVTLISNRQLPYKEFILRYDKLYSKLQAIDNEFIEDNPSDFSWLIENERLSRYYGELCVVNSGRVMDNELWERVKNHKSYLTSNDGMLFYRYLYAYISIAATIRRIQDWNTVRSFSAIDDTGRNIIDSLNFYQELKNRQQPYNAKSYNTLVRQANMIFSDTILALNTLKTIKTLDSIFEPAKADFLKIQMEDQDPDNQKIILKLVLKHMSTAWCQNIVKAAYQIATDKLKTINDILNRSNPIGSLTSFGQPVTELPFGAKLYKVNNLKVPELLANLKSSFQGKAILIDFWATWCAPCLSDMPYSKKLQETTKDLPIEFVYLCTSSSSSIDKWKSKIAELEIPGTHIFVDAAIETELMKLFSVSGFPSIVFIDRNGVYKPGAIKMISNTDKNKLTELINSTSR